MACKWKQEQPRGRPNILGFCIEKQKTQKSRSILAFCRCRGGRGRGRRRWYFSVFAVLLDVHRMSMVVGKGNVNMRKPILTRFQVCEH